MSRLSDEVAVAVLLIGAGLASDPASDVDTPHPVYAGNTGAGSKPHVNVVATGSDDEPRNHTGRQLSRPIINIEIHTTTLQAAWDQGMALQQFCDHPEPRTAVSGDDSVVIETMGRTSAVKQLGQHPKTKLFVAGVTVILSTPSMDPATE